MGLIGAHRNLPPHPSPSSSSDEQKILPPTIAVVPPSPRHLMDNSVVPPASVSVDESLTPGSSSLGPDVTTHAPSSRRLSWSSSVASADDLTPLGETASTTATFIDGPPSDLPRNNNGGRITTRTLTLPLPGIRRATSREIDETRIGGGYSVNDLSPINFGMFFKYR